MSEDSSKISRYKWLAGVLRDLAIVALVYIVGRLISGIGWQAAGIDSLETARSRPNELVLVYILAGTSMVLALMTLMRIFKINRKIVLPARTIKPSLLGWALLGWGSYYLLSVLFKLFVMVLFPSVDLAQKQELGLNQNLEPATLALAYLALCVVPSISEEMLFRGFLYNRLKITKLGRIAAALAVSLLFAVSHGQVNVAIDTFALSLVMIYVYEYCKGNLIVTMLMHLIKNTMAFLGLFVLKLPVG